MTQLPEFRKDLEVVPKVGEGGQFRYLIRDPHTQEIFEFGEEEYYLCKQFDGKTRIEVIQHSFQHHFGFTVRLELLRTFIHYLGSLGLLISEERLSRYAPNDRDGVKVYRLANPRRLLDFLSLVFSWCFSRAFLVIVVLVFAIAIGTAIKYAGDFMHELSFMRELSDFIVIAVIAILFLNPVTEIAKGVACAHYGGTVNAVKGYFVFRIIPNLICDVADAFYMMDKARRIRILSAGPICQIGLWSIGMIGWKNTFPGTQIHSFWALFTIAATFTFLLKFNPLLERDGYYLLSTWLQIPFLKIRAKALTKSWALRRPVPEPLSSREIVIFKRYGFLSAVYRFIFWCLFLGWIGYHLTLSLNGVGACIFMAILFLRYEDTIKKQLAKLFLRGGRFASQAGVAKLRLLFRFGLLFILVILLLVPYPFMAGGEFRLLPVKQVGVRSQVTSEIETVFVTEGQWVHKGDPIVKLTGRDQQKRVEAAQAELDRVKANLDLLLAGAKPEAIAAARQEVKTAAKSLEYSTLSAARYAKLIRDNAASQQSYENALKIRDLDRERLELAKRNLEYVESGARDEEIQSLEAQVRRLEVELSHAQGDLELVLLTSPVTGRIITPHLEQKIGQVLFEGDMFAVVEDANTVIAEIAVPEEDVPEVRIGARVKLKPWGYPTQAFKGEVVAIAPVAFEKSRERVERTLSEREWLYGRKPTLKERGKVIRVLSELPNEDGLLKTDMTGYAKIDCDNKPVIVAFTRWLVRFVMIEVWSWIP